MARQPPRQVPQHVLRLDQEAQQTLPRTPGAHAGFLTAPPTYCEAFLRNFVSGWSAAASLRLLQQVEYHKKGTCKVPCANMGTANCL